MKVQIRRGCFETNSSSTHSLQLVKSDQNALEVLVKAIASEIKYWDDKKSNEFIKNNKLVLKGLKGAGYSDECDVVVVISQWMPKIQYLYSYIVTSLNYISDYYGVDIDDVEESKNIDNSLFAYLSLPYKDKFKAENVKKLWQVQELVNLIKDTSTYKDETIIFEDVIESHDDNEDSNAEDIFTYAEITNRDLFKAKLQQLMNTSIIAANIAYSAYDGKYFYIY